MGNRRAEATRARECSGGTRLIAEGLLSIAGAAMSAVVNNVAALVMLMSLDYSGSNTRWIPLLQANR